MEFFFGVTGVNDEQRPLGTDRYRLTINWHGHYHIVLKRIGQGQLHSVIVEGQRPDVLAFGLNQLQDIAQQGSAEGHWLLTNCCKISYAKAQMGLLLACRSC